MNSVSFFNLITAVTGFVVSVLLVFSSGQNRYVNRFLGLGFFVAALRSLSVFAVQEHVSNNNFFIGTVSFVFYLIPPCYYLYFRSAINDEQKMRKNDWVHFVIPVLAFLLLVYYCLRSLILNGNIALPQNQIVLNEVSEFPGHIIPKYHAFSIFILCVFYTVISWITVMHKLRIQKYEHMQVKKIRNWILTLLITCTLLLLVVFYNILLMLVFRIKVSLAFNPDILRSVILILIFSRILFNPDLLFGIPKIQTRLPVVDYIPEIEKSIVRDEGFKSQPTAGNEPNEDALFDQDGWVKITHSDTLKQPLPGQSSVSIEKDKVLNYINRINEYMKNMPFLNTDFDMKTMSKELQIPLYHLEYIFRYYNKNSFTEYRNKIRVRYVLGLLSNGMLSNLTIEAIGMKAGFSSRSSFFRVFKAITGKTPKQFVDK